LWFWGVNDGLEMGTAFPIIARHRLDKLHHDGKWRVQNVIDEMARIGVG
jgi:hypothetical protein